MAESKVQLKREEIVGNEVNLEDINPITSTDSVVDESTGLDLNETLARLKDAINNKLSRIVNSVNGRTGVVVLTSKDVGLENVDNISFADIQDWAIDQIAQEFKMRGFRLYEDMASLREAALSNEKSLDGSGFFVASGEEGDKKAYIGHFKWDNGELKYPFVKINIIGETDSSIIYDEKVGDRDYRGGKIGINIWKDEDGLEIYEGPIDPTTGPKGNSGLRINREKVLPSTTFFEGCYGSKWDEPGESTDSWLYLGMDNIPEDAPEVIIYYDDEKLTTTEQKFYAKKVFKVHDIIICAFSSKYVKLRQSWERDDPDLINRPVLYPDGLCERLINRHIAHGVVTEVKKNEFGDITRYTVKFHSFKQNVMGGLVYTSQYGIYPGHRSQDYFESDENGKETDIGGRTINFGPYKNDALMIRLPSGAVTTAYEIGSLDKTNKSLIVNKDFSDKYLTPITGADGTVFDQEAIISENIYWPMETLTISENTSGLTVRENPIRTSVTNDLIDGYELDESETLPRPINNNWRYTNLPCGPFPSYDPRFHSKIANYGGIEILPDASLCVIPAESYMDRNGKGASGAGNWTAPADFYIPDKSNRPDDAMISSNTALGGECLLGINLNKAIDYRIRDGLSIPYMANASGLRVYQNGPLPDELSGGAQYGHGINGDKITGGLAINCGKFLKIEPPTFYDSHTKFYDGGKLTLDIDLLNSVLHESSDGKLELSIAVGRGLRKYVNDTGKSELGIDLNYNSPFKFEYRNGRGSIVAGTTAGITTYETILDENEYINYGEMDDNYRIETHPLTGNVILTATKLGINVGDGLETNPLFQQGKLNIKIASYAGVYDPTTKQALKNPDGTYKRIKVPRGLCFYKDIMVHPWKEDHPYERQQDERALGIQVMDPDTKISHGLSINEKGTLCVDLFGENDSSNNESGGSSSGSGSGGSSLPGTTGNTVIKQIIDHMELTTWSITGKEVLAFNGVLTDEINEKTYSYNPFDEPLRIKLGKGLIFVDDRGADNIDDDEDGCGCSGCKCNYCDYEVNMPGKETYKVLTYIQSDGTQRIKRTSLVCSTDNNHIFMPKFIETESVPSNQTIFELGLSADVGTQTFGIQGGKIRVSLVDKNEDVVALTQTAEEVARRGINRFAGQVIYKVNNINVVWKYENDKGVATEATTQSVDCDSNGLAVKMLSLFGPVGHRSDTDSPTIARNAKIKFYGLTVMERDEDTIIANYIPVLCASGARKGHTGVFDTVSHTFYPNEEKIDGIISEFIPGEETGKVLDAKGNDISPVDPTTLVVYDEVKYAVANGKQKIVIDDLGIPEGSKIYVVPDFRDRISDLVETELNNVQYIFSVGGELDKQTTTPGTFYLGIIEGVRTVTYVDTNNVAYKLKQHEEDIDVVKESRYVGYVEASKSGLNVSWASTKTNIPLDIVEPSISTPVGTVFESDVATTPITVLNSVNGNSRTGAQVYLYRLSIYVNSMDQLFADCVPVVSSNGDTGLMDLINGKFYPCTTGSGLEGFDWIYKTGKRYDYKGQITGG